jgi:hypothetical protein
MVVSRELRKKVELSEETGRRGNRGPPDVAWERNRARRSGCPKCPGFGFRRGGDPLLEECANEKP